MSIKKMFFIFVSVLLICLLNLSNIVFAAKLYNSGEGNGNPKNTAQTTFGQRPYAGGATVAATPGSAVGQTDSGGIGASPSQVAMSQIDSKTGKSVEKPVAFWNFVEDKLSESRSEFGSVRQSFIIKNQKELNKMFKLMYPNELMPNSWKVDFKKYCLIAIYAGDCPTSGYKIEIPKVVSKDDIISVHIYIGNDSIKSFPAISRPYKMILIEATDKNILIQDDSEKDAISSEVAPQYE